MSLGKDNLATGKCNWSYAILTCTGCIGLSVPHVYSKKWHLCPFMYLSTFLVYPVSFPYTLWFWISHPIHDFKTQKEWTVTEW